MKLHTTFSSSHVTRSQEHQDCEDEPASPSTVWSFVSSFGSQDHQERHTRIVEHNRALETLADDSPTLGFQTRAGSGLELDSGPVLDDSEGSGFFGSEDTASELSYSDGDDVDFFECSPQPQSPAPDDVSPSDVDVLSEVGLKAFLRTWPRSHTRKRRASWPSSSGCRKRLKVECFGEYVGGEESIATHNEGDVFDETVRPMRMSFACPFYIRHPDHYSRCLTRIDIRGVRDLLRHLYNSHVRPIYCPTCRAIFTISQECDDHIRRRQCKLREPSHCLGITPEQVQQLSRQAHNWRVAGLAPNHNIEALQWFGIWAIVFPKDEVPLRPYLSGDLESAICAMRDFWSAEGRIIVSEFLETQGLQDACSRNEGQSFEALRRAVLNHMTDNLVTSFKQDVCDNLRGPEKIQKVLASLGRLFLKDHRVSALIAA